MFSSTTPPGLHQALGYPTPPEAFDAEDEDAVTMVAGYGHLSGIRCEKHLPFAPTISRTLDPVGAKGRLGGVMSLPLSPLLRGRTGLVPLPSENRAAACPCKLGHALTLTGCRPTN